MRGKRVLVKSDHTITLQGEVVPFALKRSNQRRSIGLKIDSHGLTVSAPLFAGLSEIEKALIENAAWVFQKLNQWTSKPEDSPSFEVGSPVWWLGRQVPLVAVDPKEAIPRVLSEEEAYRLDQIPVAQGIECREAALTAWYKVQALPWFTRRFAVYAEKLGARAHQIKLSDAEGRWGSCTHRGVIRLNWRLIQASPTEIDYVIAHECAHLKHMNHSADFWGTVEALFPNWKEASKTLAARDRVYRSL